MGEERGGCVTTHDGACVMMKISKQQKRQRQKGVYFSSSALSIRHFLPPWGTRGTWHIPEYNTCRSGMGQAPASSSSSSSSSEDELLLLLLLLPAAATTAAAAVAPAPTAAAAVAADPVALPAAPAAAAPPASGASAANTATAPTAASAHACAAAGSSLFCFTSLSTACCAASLINGVGVEVQIRERRVGAHPLQQLRRACRPRL